MEEDIIKVLMIEDSSGDALLINEMLKESRITRIKLKHNVQLSSAIERLRTEKFHVIILDLGLPDSAGLSTLQKLQKESGDLPIIIMSGMEDEETGIKAAEMGAQDYIIKGQIDGSALLRSIRYAIERKKAEKLIREAEEKFKATFELAAVGIAHLSPEGNWLRVNQKLCSMLQYEREELLKHNFREITHPDDLKTDLENREKLLKGEIQTFTLEKRYLRKDNSPIWVNITVSPVISENNKIDYFIAVIEDIDARKQSENSFTPNLYKFPQIFYKSTSAIKITTFPEDRFLEVNEAFENLTGFKREEIIGKTREETGLLKDPADALRQMDILRKNGAVSNLEFSIRTRDNRALSLIMSSAIIEANDGLCVISFLEDVNTHKKNLENINKLLKDFSKSQDNHGKERWEFSEL